MTESVPPHAGQSRASGKVRAISSDQGMHPDAGARGDAQERGLYGMQTFDQHLLELYRASQLKLEVAKAAASVPEDFERAVTFE